jgi:hypothetical protein
MYSLLYTDMIRTRQEEIASRTIHPHDVQDVGAAAGRPSGRARRAIATLGVCVAAASAVAITDASANPQRTNRHTRVSAAQLAREIRAFNTVGFVATSCEAGGTLMTNYSTGQSLLLSL